jgi:hypothetical protein
MTLKQLRVPCVTFEMTPDFYLPSPAPASDELN